MRTRLSAYSLVLLLGSAFASSLYAEVLTPVRASATSEFGEVDFLGVVSDIFVDDLIDGGGLIDLEETPDNVLDDLHDFDAFWNQGWHSGDFDAGIAGGLDEDGDPFTAPLVEEQILEFDLGAPASVTTMHIWQQNQSGLAASLAADRGVDEFQVLVSTQQQGDAFELVGNFSLDPEEGKFETPAQVIEFDNPVTARRIRFQLLSALSGNEREFVGLGEVRFEGERLNSSLGDFNVDGMLDAIDIDLLTTQVNAATHQVDFDLNDDQLVDETDRIVWVETVKHSFFGDANLDGEFNSSDFVEVFGAGEYEDGIPKNSTWATGDWNGDGEFDSSDFVIAFLSAGFETGPRPPASATVPEPKSVLWFVVALVAVTGWQRRSVRRSAAN